MGVSNNNHLLLMNRTDPERQQRYDKGIAKFVCRTLVPFQAMEHIGLVLETLEPSGRVKVQIRSDRTVSAHVEKYSLECLDDVYSYIAEMRDHCEIMCFTTDLWKNPQKMYFMALTTHWIDEEFRLVKFVPFVEPFRERHTGKNLSLRLTKFIKKLGLEKMDIKVVCDNASNNGVMVRLTEGIEVYYCFNHTLALVIKDSFSIKHGGSRSLNDLIKKVQELWKFLKTGNREQQLIDAAVATETPYRKVKQHCPTRWNSKHDALESANHLKKPLQYLANSDYDWQLKVPDVAEFNLSVVACKILLPFKIATKLCEADKVATAQHVIPELWNLKSVLVEQTRSSDPVVKHFATCLLNSLTRRFPEGGTTLVMNNVCHYLDPRYKGVILKKYPPAYEQAKEWIRKFCMPAEENVDRNGGQENPTVPVDENLSAADRLMLECGGDGDGQGGGGQGNQSPLDIEFYAYEKMKFSNPKELLPSWKSVKDKLPLLAKVARNVFSLQVTSSSSERAFSVGTKVSTSKRFHLAPEKIENTVVFNINMNLVENYRAKKTVPKLKMPEIVSSDVVEELVDDADNEYSDEEAGEDYYTEAEAEEEQIE